MVVFLIAVVARSIARSRASDPGAQVVQQVEAWRRVCKSTGDR